MLAAKQKRIDKIFENMDKKRDEFEDQTITLDITDDMYCGFLSQEVVQEFTCMLCYGIVIDPIKCYTCCNLVCKKCVNITKVEQNRQECYKKCGSTRMGPLNQTEKHIYDSLLFRCQNDECMERIPLKQYRSHMRTKCKVQTYDRVIMPQGATQQFDNYGNELDGVEIDEDVFDDCDDELGCPYTDILNSKDDLLQNLFKEV